MPLQQTFAALQGVHSAGLVPALRAALRSGNARLATLAARALASHGGSAGHLVLFDHVASLEEGARREAAGGVALMRNSLLHAARDGDANQRNGALTLLELCGDIEAAEPLAEFLTDKLEDHRARAGGALQAILEKFLRDRHPAATGTTSGIEKVRVLCKALRAALESYSRHRCGFVPLAALRMGADFKPLLTDALRLELAGLRDEPGPLEGFLAECADPRVLEYLLDRLGDPLPEVRSAARRVWRRKHGVAAGQALSAILENIDESRLRRSLSSARGAPFIALIAGNAAAFSRAALMRLIGIFKQSSCDTAARVEFYATLGESRETAVSDECRSALMALGADAVAPHLIGLTTSASARGALFALTTLAEMGHPGALKAASDMLRADRPELRDAAARFAAARAYRRYQAGFEKMSEAERREGGALLRLVDDEVVDDLRRQISAADPEVRLRALRILDLSHNAPRLKDSVLGLMHDADARVRATVVGMLSALRNEDAAGAIRELLDDPDTRVRANAIEAVEALADPTLAPALTRFLEDPNNRIRGNAAKALYILGVEGAAGVMRAMLEDEAELMRMSAAWAISQTNPPGGEIWLRSRLTIERSEGVRARLENALRKLGAHALKVLRPRTAAVTRRVEGAA